MLSILESGKKPAVPDVFAVSNQERTTTEYGY
jgi:hypothetical protein